LKPITPIAVRSAEEPLYWCRHRVMLGMIAALAVIDAVWLAFFTDLRVGLAGVALRFAIAAVLGMAAAYYGVASVFPWPMHPSRAGATSSASAGPTTTRSS
jgi:hypothetical protein